MKKPLFAFLGLVCVVLGFMGIFLPVLPTTPFLLLAAWLFVKSSDKLYQWLISHKLLGAFIKSYSENRAISLKSKFIALFLLWGSMSYSIIFVIQVFWLKLLMVGIGLGISILILRIRNLSA